MTRPDLNLLVALEALLEEESVAGAARRLRLSPSAMSRTLARLRETTGDPLLVRAGRGVVPTPRAEELRERVSSALEAAEALLRPAAGLDLAALEETYTLRTGDGFVETFGPRLIARVRAEAPRVRLRFVQRLGRDSALLRGGGVDLETGVVGPETAPEVRSQLLFRDRLVVAVRAGHPLRARELTADAYASAQHVETTRHVPKGGRELGPTDAALDALGLRREVVAVVGGFSTALALARGSDLVATVPERHTVSLREGLETAPLPLAVDDVAVSMFWHPRRDADPGHRWLRRCLREVCADAPPTARST